MTTPEVLYREDIRQPVMKLAAGAMAFLAIVFVVLAFTDPFAAGGRGDGAGEFFIPAALFLILATFVISFGKFTVIATSDRLNIIAGMNSNSIYWAEIESFGEDFSRRSPGNPLTAVPTAQDGERVMVYAIGSLPRVEVQLRLNNLRRLIFPTRHLDELMNLIKERSRNTPEISADRTVQPEEELVKIDWDRQWPGGFGGPPIFRLP
ncbi:hypothetical protein [Dehalogenimonas etheniformans]|nr:hypothetical protein [Dehalogenimonas etheniformans]QNT76592.1 hypothetical protein HX448_07805 [Dehalogenimonas etheniformans]